MTTKYGLLTHPLSSSCNNIRYTLDTLSIVYVPWSRGIEVELSVGEGKLSVGEVKLSVKLTESHSSATEITIAWLK